MSVSAREERAAILLSGLDPDTAESVLSRLAPEQGTRLRTQMNLLSRSKGQGELLSEVVQEFGVWMRTTGHDSAAKPTIRLDKGTTYGEGWEKRPQAPILAEKPVADKGNGSSGVEYLGDSLAALRQLPADQLAAALDGEHSRTISLVLDALDTTHAGEVLKRLPLEVRREVSIRLGQGLEGNKVLLQQIARALVQKTRGNENLGSKSSALRASKIAEMLRALDRVDRLDLLASLEQRDPETAARVRSNLYRFEDLTQIADKCVQKLLAETDLRTLVIALKDAPESVTQKVMTNISSRVQESVATEAEGLGPIAPVQIQLARRTVIESILRLDQAGELIFDE